MKRFILILAVSLALMPLLKSTAFGRPFSGIRPVVSSDHGLSVDLWTNRDQDDVYAVNEYLEVYFRANSDCYISIYAIDTEGQTEIIFPRYPDDGFVFGGTTYRLPDYYDDLDLRLRGPHGVGYLHAVASRSPRPFRFRVLHGRYDLRFDPVSGDPFLAINAINRRLIHARHMHANATVSFFVGRRVWYPRYMCYDCHGRTVGFDPYYDACPRYTVRATRGFDYWWGYDYHPVRTRLVFGGPFWRFELRAVPVHRHRYRYVDCAIGFGNYRPMRPIYRPHTKVIYRSPVQKTRRTYRRQYAPVTYRQTAVRRSGNTRSGVSRSSSGVSRSSSGVSRSSSGVSRSSSGVSRSSSGVSRSSSGVSRSSSGVSRSSSGVSRSSSGVSRSSSGVSTGRRSARSDGTRSTTASQESSNRQSAATRSITPPSSGPDRSRGVRTKAPSPSSRSTRSTPSSSSPSRRTTSTSRGSSGGDDVRSGGTRSSSRRSFTTPRQRGSRDR